MNKDRRAKLQNAIDLIEDVIDEEQDAYDNMPENLQYSEKGEKMDEGIDSLETAKDILEEVNG